MAVIVFLRGVNVGGSRTFRPSVLARALGEFDVVNVGAAGTFVVRRPPTRARLRAAFVRELPFETHLMLCDGQDILALERERPLGATPARADVVRFVSILPSARRKLPPLPLTIPTSGPWSVRLIGADGCFIFGEYRRHMRAIRDLGQIDKVVGAPVTTRNWNTIMAVAKILRSA